MNRDAAPLCPRRVSSFLAKDTRALRVGQVPPPAAASSDTAPRARGQDHKQTADLLKTHRWDETQGTWADEPPPGAKAAPKARP